MLAVTSPWRHRRTTGPPLLKEIREFALRGNVIDLAVGIIIGTAFSKISQSLVNDVIMPPLSYVISGVNVTGLAITLAPATEARAAVILRYGAFMQTLLDFLIIALAIFLIVRLINQMRRREEARETPAITPAPTKQESLLAEIRDLLKAQHAPTGTPPARPGADAPGA